MVDAHEDFIAMGRSGSPITKGVTPSDEGDGAGRELRGEDAPPT